MEEREKDLFFPIFTEMHDRFFFARYYATIIGLVFIFLFSTFKLPFFNIYAYRLLYFQYQIVACFYLFKLFVTV